ncbi:28 kDa ribonucleoprotein, chloroplastic-like [Typha angustifolia]|uniref:28 kDa ribonucleoprotein, chloroplastic-like n=1 Tax=Typha angustifolia TaxID=59011 RepID=UPI003C2C7DB6
MAAAVAFHFSPNLKCKPKTFSPATKIRSSLYAPPLFCNPRSAPSRLLRLRPRSAVQELAVDENEGAVSVPAEEEKRRKLYVVNLPWNLSAPDIEKLFGECGTVKDVEIIKQKNGQNRGFAFVTMASGEEARAVVDKFDSYELMGRIIRVEFAKSFRKPPTPPPPGAIVVEERHKIYVSNLAWKARSGNLREFFSEKFKPLSARVVFENPTGRSAGYGFVAFATKEEAEAAISELDGKELMGRPVRLRVSEKADDQPESASEEANDSDGQPDES